LSRFDAASALAALVRGISDDCHILTFSEKLIEVPPRYGMALIDAIRDSQPNVGTYLGRAVESLRTMPAPDRLIVITDEQTADRVGKPVGRGYLVNVASCENGIGYGDWTHINGFSEAIVRYISEIERIENPG
jgi:hypothetical protein